MAVARLTTWLGSYPVYLDEENIILLEMGASLTFPVYFLLGSIERFFESHLNASPLYRIGEKQFLGVRSYLIDSGALYLLSPIIDMAQRSSVVAMMSGSRWHKLLRSPFAEASCITGFLRFAITIICSGMAPILKGNHRSSCDYSDPMVERLDNMQKNWSYESGEAYYCCAEVI
jgi:hypothetical protein